MYFSVVDGALSDAHLSRLAADRYALQQGLAELRAARRQRRRDQSRRTALGRMARRMRLRALHQR